MTASLPTERDFDPTGNGLDEQWAWKYFGGLTLEEANTKFRENPFVYQEAFMFMGGMAFAFYFPIVDSFLREVPVPDGDDREAWILAHCIEQQFDGQSLPQVRHLAPRVLDLAEFMLANICVFATSDSDEQRRIGTAWEQLKGHIEKCINSPVWR
jgi:hypothetical protein